MNIQLFNFLEDHFEETLRRLEARVDARHAAWGELPADGRHELLRRLIDGYVDYLVVGQADALEPLFRALSRVLLARGAKFSDVFELPLDLSTVIRELLAKEYAETAGEDAISRFGKALEEVDGAAHRMACRFIDTFQEMLMQRIEEHNAYLARVQAETGVDLSAFMLVAEPHATAARD